MKSPIPSDGPSSLLGHAGQVALTAVKHVPTRMALWGVLGFLTGAAGIALSYLLGILAMGRGALILGYLVAIPLAIPLLGALLFGIHGLHRGTAHALLALETKLGLVSHVTNTLVARLDERFGARLATLPLQTLEDALNDVVARYLGAEDPDLGQGRGLMAYVLRRARAGIARRVSTYLLAAYREETHADGTGGGIAMAKVQARATEALSSRLGDLVFAPLNKQRAILVSGYLVLAAGWWFWLLLILAGLHRVAP